MTLTLTPSSLSDVERLAGNLRWADRVEITRSMQTDSLTALRTSYETSQRCYTVWTPKGEPVCMVGMAETPKFPKVGIIWLLGSRLCEDHPLGLLRLAPPVLTEGEQLYPHGLQNYVDAENTLSRRWLKLLGFVELQEVQVNGFPFIHVYRSPEFSHV
jgi:hypothetical protein